MTQGQHPSRSGWRSVLAILLVAPIAAAAPTPSSDRPIKVASVVNDSALFPNPYLPLPDLVPSMVFGDLDGDKDSDLVMARTTWSGQTGFSVLVLLNDGDGSFGPMAEYIVGYSPRSVGLGDLDSDGDLDIAVANSLSSSTISVLLNHGDGTFAGASSFAAGPAASSLVIADLDGDTHPDLAVANLNFVFAPGDQVSVLLNAGDGTFGAPTSYTVARGPRSLAVGDLDGDGDQDLVAASYTTATDGTLSILKNDGHGFFTPLAFASTSVNPVCVAIARLDGDADLDVVVVAAGSACVDIFRNQGDGTLGSPVSFATGGVPSSVAVGDLDEDHDADLAVSNSAGAAILFNDGGGRFGQPTTYRVQNVSRSVAIADIDSDMDLDIVVAAFSSYAKFTFGGVEWLLNRGGGKFPANLQLEVAKGRTAAALADFDRDGDLDIAMVDDVSDTLTLLTNDGAARFAGNTRWRVGRSPSFVAVGDMNRDHQIDVAVLDYVDNTISVLLNDGRGGLRAPMSYPTGVNPTSAAIGDLDADGDAEIVVANSNSNFVSVLRNVGGGTFAPQAIWDVGAKCNGVALGDLDGDADLDVVIAMSTGNQALLVLFNRGDGTIANYKLYLPSYCRSVSIADVDGDGDGDLIVVVAGGASVLRNNGHGVFGAAVSYAGGQTIAVADLDGDGDPDLVQHGLWNEGIGVRRNAGNGTFAVRSLFGGLDADPVSTVDSGDLDADGDADLVVAMPGRLWLLLNQRVP